MVWSLVVIPPCAKTPCERSRGGCGGLAARKPGAGDGHAPVAHRALLQTKILNGRYGPPRHYGHPRTATHERNDCERYAPFEAAANISRFKWSPWAIRTSDAGNKGPGYKKDERERAHDSHSNRRRSRAACPTGANPSTMHAEPSAALREGEPAAGAANGQAPGEIFPNLTEESFPNRFVDPQENPRFAMR